MSTSTSTLWAVGSYVDADGRRAPWEISHDEINRDIGSATRVLTDLGVSGKGVLWCSMLAEAGQFWPYVCGTVMAGARLSCADATSGEATRVAMFLRLMPYDAVLGINDAVLDGCDDLGLEYSDVFAGVRVLGAVPGAYERLARAGCTPTRFAACGPALAIASAPDEPAHVIDDEWELSARDGRVCVTALRPRAQLFERTPTFVRGEVVGGGVMW
jgi:hypothetical protein